MFADFAGRPSRPPSSLKEERMEALTLAASVVLVLVLGIFAVISILALVGPDSRRW